MPTRKLWEPSGKFIENANLTKYNTWLKEHYNLQFNNYADLWKWSVENIALFWKSITEYFNVQFHSPYKEVLSSDPMPYARWFEGGTLNYAEHVFRNKTSEWPAIYYASETREMTALSWDEFEKQTAALQAYLKKLNLKSGDRVAAYIPNIPQASVALMATISAGAVWSSCSPDFGSESVLDRFKQIAPKVLIAVDGYVYNNKPFDRRDIVKEISEQLPTVEKIILIKYLNPDAQINGIHNVITWDEVMATPNTSLIFTPVPFSHPIWVLYSSGTTGIPKAITHSHGGMLLEHLKYLAFHNDVHPGENFFWFSTTGWMMWNFVQASSLVGATMVLYDGNPGYPNLGTLWKIARQLPIHHFGTSAPYIIACKKRNLDPNDIADFQQLRSIGSTGAPLPPEGFSYVYENIKKDVWLCSMSGGTDICTALAGGNPWLPVMEGEIQCRALGCAMYAYNEEGKPVIDEVGEMVITKPMPCMPVYFWNDRDFKRYHSSYFEFFPGVWRHGDWITIKPDGGLVIHGRSDTTLNRQGVRIGTAEIYRAVDNIPEIKDSLIVNIELKQGGDFMPLFVIMQESETLTEEIKTRIRKHIREVCSPRHVPDEITEAPDLPYTISGKKMEAPVKRILIGWPVEKAANPGAMRNPESLNFFVSYRKENNLTGRTSDFRL